MNRDTASLSGVQIREWEIYLEGNDFIQHNNITIPMGGSRVTQIISAKTGIIIEKKNSKGEYEKSVRLKDGFVLEWNEKKMVLSLPILWAEKWIITFRLKKKKL